MAIGPVQLLVLGFNHPNFHGEIIENGVSGYLVPLRDIAALADRVIDLLASPDCARAMGARLRAKLLTEHSLQAVVPLYRRAYDLALRGVA